MSRFLKWLVWSTGICFVLIVAVIVAVQIFLSSDEIIRIAEREGRKILGRKVSIERLELGLFKIEASGIVIDGQAKKGGGKSNTPFVRFDDVEILLNPSTLIYRRISILRLSVKSASARVHRDAGGRFNFQDIIDRLHRGTSKSASVHGRNTFSFIKSAEAAESVPQGSESGFGFVIHELDLYGVHTELRFDAGDAAPAFDGSCSFVHIEVDKIVPGKPLDVFLDGKCRSPSGQRLIELKGDAHIDMKGSRYRASFEMPAFDASSLPEVSPTLAGYHFRKGIFAGNLKFSYVAGKPVSWNIDLNGQNIHADFQRNRQAKWRKLELADLNLKTEGRFNLPDGSARIDTLFVKTPFLDAKLVKPSFWNVSAQDEVHLETNVRDMREAGEWLSKAAGIALRGLRESATARILISARRDRRISDEFVYVEVDSRFDPIDLARFEEWLLPFGHLSKIKGAVGGKARLVFVSGERVRWNASLEARDLGANVRGNERKPRQVLALGRAVLRSRGNFDMKNESAHIEMLDIELPFAAAKLQKPAKWNVDGNDEAAFSVDIRDFSSANDFLKRLGRISFGDVPRDAKLRLNAAVSRDRKIPSSFQFEAKAHFASLPIAPVMELVPLQKYLHIAAGRVSGALQVSSNPEGALHWKADILGKKLVAKVGLISGEKPRQVSLESMGLQSSGFYLASKGSAEIRTLDLKLPFARAFLNRQALWNKRGRDAFSLTLDVMDWSAAEVWLGALVANPVKPGPRRKRLKILLAGTRNRRGEPGFSYTGSASFESVRISPWVKFVSLPPALRNPVGEVGGNIAFSYAPGKKVHWNLGLTSEGLGGEFPSLMSRDRRAIQTGKFRLETTGSYDFRNQSGRMQSLSLGMPFGRLRVSRPVDWNMNGIDSGRLQWSLSSLAGAARLAEGILGTPASAFSAAGSAKGAVEISRKARSVITNWSVAGNLSSLAHVNYPGLRLAGSFSAQGDDDSIKIRIPTLQFGKPNVEPDVVLQGMSASLDRSSILRGEIRSPSVRVEKLNVRYVRQAKGSTNFDALFRAAKTKEKRPRVGERREKTATADTETVPGKRRKTGRKESGPLFPAIQIAKFEVARMLFYYQDSIAAGRPPVVFSVPDARILITNLDTLMAPNLRKTRLALRTLGKSPSILFQANLNPGLVSPDVDGFFDLSHFDLRIISPYVRDSKGESVGALLMRGTKITRGMLDFKSTYSLRKSRLNLAGTARITGLRLKPDAKFPLVDLVVKLLRESVFRLFERPDDTMKLNVRVTGRLDDPEFHFLDAIAEPMFVSLLEKAQNLGGNVKDIVAVILGTAIEGVQKIVPAPRDDRTTPDDKGSARELDRGESQLEQFGKKIEKSLRKGLRGLFGVK